MNSALMAATKFGRHSKPRVVSRERVFGLGWRWHPVWTVWPRKKNAYNGRHAAVSALSEGSAAAISHHRVWRDVGVLSVAVKNGVGSPFDTAI